MSAVLKPKRGARAKRPAPTRPTAPTRRRTAAHAAPSVEPPFESNVSPSALDERDRWRDALRARLRSERVDASLLAESRLLRLGEMFGLSAYEVDVVAALWTSIYDAAWRAEIAARDASGHMTALGIARAFGHEPRARLASESPLRLWRIVAEHAFVEGGAALSLDVGALAWLDGANELDRELVEHARLLQPLFELPSWQLADCAERIVGGLARGERFRVRIRTDDLVAADACAAALAQRLGVCALGVGAGVGASEHARERAVRVQRQAFFDRCAPRWHARDADVAWPSEVAPFALQFVVGAGALPRDERFRDIDLALDDPRADERRALWLAALPSAARWPSVALDELALGVDASVGEIIGAAATQPRDAEAAARSVRNLGASDIGALAQPLPRTFGWDDLVVPASLRERLRDIAFEARERARVWAAPDAMRLYPQGRGLVALLAGPPGTGKTMSAQVIAADLGLELLRIDISSVLSKWVGETAQHLQKVLSSPASRRAVLLFDEADALFGKRIEDARQAQDHFVNLDLSHLMVALESYTGIVLLATNLKANIDAAFVRRIRHAIDFPMPDATARAAIWARAIEALFGADGAHALRDGIARVSRIEASGAQIKNAALSATFAGRRENRMPDAALLGAMLARELAKDGAGMSARELTSIMEGAS